MSVTANLSANPTAIPILVYHQIDKAPPPGAPYRNLYVSPKRFATQMAMLKLMGYRGLSMRDLQPYLRGTQQGKVVGLTFDDGYVNNLTHALPVLRKHGFSATCYVVSQQLGGQNVWDKEIGIAQVPLMDAVQMRQWMAGGQEIGAHTRNHVHLDQLDTSAAETEIMGCKQELEAVLDGCIDSFCYPYGDFVDANVEQVRRAGFSNATTTQRGRCHAGLDMLRLRRIPVQRSTQWFQFWLKLQTAYEDRKTVKS